MFKKKEIKNKKKEIKEIKVIKLTENKFANIISYVWIVIIFILLFFLVQKKWFLDFKIYDSLDKNPVIKNLENKSLEEQKKILLEKQKAIQKAKQKKILDEKKINILLIWRGWYGNDAPELTDSLILLSYFPEKHHISMLSIPRDLYVDYNLTKNWKKLKWKINALYVMSLEQTQNREKSTKVLEKKIEQITNEKIDYYVNIDFRWFVKLINSIWWVKITVPKTLVDTKYPDANHWFQTFTIQKWTWLLDWATALKYVRTRKNTGWDFWRSQRQQQVIKAIKEKIFTASYLTSPSKIKKLYNIFHQYIKTDIWLIDFVNLATKIKFDKNLKFLSIWLNASCIRDDECNKWWFLYYPARRYFWGQSVLLVEWSNYYNLENYSKIHTFSDLVFNNFEILQNNYKISIFSKRSKIYEAKKLKNNLIKLWFNIKAYDIIWFIPENFIDEKWSFWDLWIKKSKTNLTLYEYNKSLKNKKNIVNNHIKTKNWIEKEAYNNSTKLIINNISLNSKTVSFLKDYLHLENKDIIISNKPKYSKNKNTRIEILFKK